MLTRLLAVAVALASFGASSAFVQNRQAFVAGRSGGKAASEASSREGRAVAVPQGPETSASALMGIMENFVEGRDAATRKSDNEAYLAGLKSRVDRINALEPPIEDLDDDELQAKTAEFRERLQNGEDITGPILEEAFAVVREAAW